MDRDPTVWLASDVARCTNTHGCSKAESCARFRAPVPRNGSMADFSEAARVIGECTRYMPITRGYAPSSPAPVVKDWPKGGD